MLKNFWQNYKLVSNPSITPPDMVSRAGNLAENDFFNTISQIKGLNIYKNNVLHKFCNIIGLHTLRVFT